MTQWQPLYLRAEDETAMIDALDAAGLVGTHPETGDQLLGGDPFVIRVTILGKLYEIIDEEAVSLPGWHVNILLADGEGLPEELQDLVITPNTPKVKWAGK